MWYRKDVKYEGDLNQSVDIPEFAPVHQSNKKVWKYMLLAVLAGAVVFTAVVLLTGGSKGVSVYDGEVRLTGPYGFSLPLLEITAQLSEEELPVITDYNDSGLLQGEHSFSDGSKGFFCIEHRSAPTVIITYNGQKYYLNSQKEEDTRSFYALVLEGIEKEKALQEANGQ